MFFTNIAPLIKFYVAICYVSHYYLYFLSISKSNLNKSKSYKKKAPAPMNFTHRCRRFFYSTLFNASTGSISSRERFVSRSTRIANKNERPAAMA